MHDIDESEKICGCGAKFVRIGEESSEQLEFIPAKMRVIRHIRPKYACKVCEGAGGKDGEKSIKIAPVPPQMLPKSIATPSLLTYVLVSKFEGQPAEFGGRATHFRNGRFVFLFNGCF